MSKFSKTLWLCSSNSRPAGATSTSRTSVLCWLFVLILVVAAASPATLNAQAGNRDQDGKEPHLYFFTNEGCAPCKLVEPEVRKIAATGHPVTKVDVYEFPKWAQHFDISSTPTVLLVANRQVVVRHSGRIDSQTMEGWFAQVGFRPNAVAASAAPTAEAKSAMRDVQVKPITQTESKVSDRFAKSSSAKRLSEDNEQTLHKGTREPNGAAERRAMRASVRLRVEDPEGTSFATGTVVHSHQGESLVVTCGHVFRDAKGAGEISADYIDDDGNQRRAAGQLIFYDSEARDIGLVSIKTGNVTIPPVELGIRGSMARPGDFMFCIGCDHGRAPTIRRTSIKRTAKYDGMLKYDIYGRPVDGRSGGGLFTPEGRLVGVCNAAAVDFDEGIYSCLETIYWQIAKTNLEHLFAPADRYASREMAPQTFAKGLAGSSNGAARRAIPSGDAAASGDFAGGDVAGTSEHPWDEDMSNPQLAENDSVVESGSGVLGSGVLGSGVRGFGTMAGKWTPPQSGGEAKSDLAADFSGRTGREFSPIRNPAEQLERAELPRAGSGNAVARLESLEKTGRTDVSWAKNPVSRAGDEMEVIIIVRSKIDPSYAETITVSDPSPRLLDYLKKMRSEVSRTKSVDVAEHRNNRSDVQRR